MHPKKIERRQKAIMRELCPSVEVSEDPFAEFEAAQAAASDIGTSHVQEDDEETEVEDLGRAELGEDDDDNGDGDNEDTE